MKTADPVCGMPVDPARAITARENLLDTDRPQNSPEDPRLTGRPSGPSDA